MPGRGRPTLALGPNIDWAPRSIVGDNDVAQDRGLQENGNMATSKGARTENLSQQFKQLWCIHHPMQGPWSGSRPSVFKSSLYTAVSSPQLSLGAHLNLTNDQKKKKSPCLKACTCLRSSTCCHEQRWKKKAVYTADKRNWSPVLRPAVQPATNDRLKSERKRSPVLRPVVQPTTHDRVKSENNPTVPLYLDELPSWKL